MVRGDPSASGGENGGAVTAAVTIGRCELRVWRQTPAERLRKSLARAGIDTFVDETEADGYPGAMILVRADAVLDAPVVAALIRSPGTVFTSTGPEAGIPLAVHAPSGRAAEAADLLRRGGAAPLPAGFRLAGAGELSYWHALRKREEPYALLLTPESLGAGEWRMFMGTYKGATDFVTKWLWPRPAFHATKLCARLGLTPNTVTFVSLIAVILAFFAFLDGLWVAGLVAAWAMTFLDTVDGKLARIMQSSSKFGNVFDHSIDLVHPPFWYVAWGLGLDGALPDIALYWSLAVIIAGYVLQRVLEGISIALFKLEIHVWRPIDSLFRQVTARRNPNLALLTVAVLLGRPDWGLVAVAIWTALCLALHLLQLVQAYLAFRRDGALTSWMAKPL